MTIHRPHLLSKLPAIVVVAVMAAACSSSTPADALVFDGIRDLGQDLNRAVSATQDAATGYAEPQLAARAIEQASAASRELAETATDMQASELRSATDELVSVANRIVTQLEQGDVDGAGALRANSFVPLASQVSQMKGSLAATTQSPASSSGSSIGIAFGITALVVGGAAALLVRRRRLLPAMSAETIDDHPATEPKDDQRRDRAWDQPHPLYAGEATTGPAVDEGADTARTTRMRPIEIELRSLLEATVDQAREREWIVSLICPDVHLAGDPVRFQRAILAALGNAFLGGAELVGIVVDVVDEQVLLSIGHDAPIDDRTAQDIAVRLADQLARALSEEELGWSVSSDGEIYLTTVSAGAGRLIEAGEEIPV